MGENVTWQGQTMGVEYVVMISNQLKLIFVEFLDSDVPDYIYLNKFMHKLALVKDQCPQNLYQKSWYTFCVLICLISSIIYLII